MFRDGNIRYFEYEHGKFEFLSEYKSAEPQRGVAFLPKRGVNVHDNEVMRAFKTVNDSYIEPISFIVPRRAEVFQSDIYPPTTGIKPAMSAAEWYHGKEALPPKIDLESVYDGEAPTEVPATSKPAATQVRPPSPKVHPLVKKEAEAPNEAANSAIASKVPPPSMKAQQGSIAAAASKFADNDDESEEEDNDSSSFEEVIKPVDRSEKAAPVIASPAAKAAPATLWKAPEAGRPTTKTGPSQAAAQSSLFTPPQPIKNDTVPTQAKVSTPHPPQPFMKILLTLFLPAFLGTCPQNPIPICTTRTAFHSVRGGRAIPQLFQRHQTTPRRTNANDGVAERKDRPTDCRGGHAEDEDWGEQLGQREGWEQGKGEG